MGSISNSVISTLQFLLPGFVTAWIFYNLTSCSKPSEFERVIQALIFTLFIQAFVIIINFILLEIGVYFSVGNWTENSSLIASIIIAIIFGIVSSYYANNDKLHKYLRDKNITRESSYPSEWFGQFVNTIKYNGHASINIHK